MLNTYKQGIRQVQEQSTTALSQHHKSRAPTNSKQLIYKGIYKQYNCVFGVCKFILCKQGNLVSMAFRSTASSAALAALILCSMTLLAVTARPVASNKQTQVISAYFSIRAVWFVHFACVR